MNTNDLGLLPNSQQQIDPSQGEQQDMGQGQMPTGEDTGNSEMYKKTIQALMDKVQSKYGELNSIKFATSNQNAAQKNDILKSVFEAMKAAGIDPSDGEAINQFMAQLEQENPDLFELLNEAMNSLLGPDPNAEQSPQDTQGLTQTPEQTTPIGDMQNMNQTDMTQQPENTIPQPQSPSDPTQSPI